MLGIGSNPLMGFLFGESDMEKCEIYNKNKINPIRSTYFCEFLISTLQIRFKFVARFIDTQCS